MVVAGTRTVHRGSKGRFAGASAGTPEKVRVGSGYARSSTGTKATKNMSLGAKAGAIGKRAISSKTTTNVVRVAAATTTGLAVSSLAGGAARTTGGKIAAVALGGFAARNVMRASSVQSARPKRAAGTKLRK